MAGDRPPADGRFDGPPETCPGCGGDRLRAVTDGEVTNFLCQGCGRCWHVSLGWVSRVDPLSCPGCPEREACLALVHRDRDAPGPP